MAGCIEGILVDLSCEDPQNASFEVPGPSDSIEFMRAEPPRIRRGSYTVASPVKCNNRILCDVTDKGNIINSPRKHGGLDSPHIVNIEDEVFDFDLPVTPSTASDKSSDETKPDVDEEEVFFGPVGFRERCAATAVSSVQKENKPLSPLTPRSLDRFCKEANAVASLFIAKEEDKSDTKMMSGLIEIEGIEPLQHSSGSEEEEEATDTPSRKHNRSGTFTVQKPAVDLLAADVCEAVQVDSVKSDSEKDTLSQVPVINTNEPASVDHISEPIVDTRMGASPEKTKTIEKPKEQTGKRSASKLQQPASKIAKMRSQIPGVQSCKQTTKCPSPEEPKEAKPVSRLSMPKAGIAAKETSASGSKLRAPGLSRSNSLANRPKQIPQKSSIPGLLGRGAPATKQQLMKPGSLQRPTITSKLSESGKKAPSGPMKAVPLQTKVAKTAESLPVTPPGRDRLACSKTLRSNTPQKSSVCQSSACYGYSSTSSVESSSTPVSSTSKRRSLLPTPNKSRLNSSGSVSSRKGSSVSSCDSPLVLGALSRQRRISSSSSTGKYRNIDHIDDQSPSALKPKRALVTNTPNLPKKPLSIWSPVRRKKPVDLMDQAIMCTKKAKQ